MTKTASSSIKRSGIRYHGWTWQEALPEVRTAALRLADRPTIRGYVIDRLNAGDSDLDRIWYDAMQAFPSNPVDYYYITALHREWCGIAPVSRGNDTKFDRNAYQRQYMRQWRRKKRLERLVGATAMTNSKSELMGALVPSTGLSAPALITAADGPGRWVEFHSTDDAGLILGQSKGGVWRMARLRLNETRQRRFLEALAKTSNVKAAAAFAGTSRTQVYELRKEDPAFARAWQEAEGVATNPAAQSAVGAAGVKSLLAAALISGEISPRETADLLRLVDAHLNPTEACKSD